MDIERGLGREYDIKLEEMTSLSFQDKQKQETISFLFSDRAV